MLITCLIVGFFLGSLCSYWLCSSQLAINEVTLLRNDFKKIHDRLLSLLVENQRKP